MNLRKRRYTQVPLEEVLDTERGALRRELEDQSDDPAQSDRTPDSLQLARLPVAVPDAIDWFKAEAP